MAKDYEAINKARHDYNEEIERLTDEFNQEVAAAKAKLENAKGAAWLIRGKRIKQAEGK